MSATPSSSRLLVLLFTDLVGSTDLKTRLGTAAYTELATRHDQLFQTIIASVEGARILNDLGDGFMASFETPSQAVQAALVFQRALAVERWPIEHLQARIGIHLGEVTLIRGEQTQPKVIGLAADIASRVMNLALPGQSLLTRAAFDDARQYVRAHPHEGPIDDRPILRWMAHGPYQFKGGEQPLEVFEVGAEGIAPLSAPPDSEKARRSVRVDEEETLGWRPAVGLEVPGRPGWKLERELGSGGFGEVWLGKHTAMHEHRVFKFCFDVERLRSFRRELTLFRLLREALGDRSDIARLYEVQLAEPPYYLESEYSQPGNLAEWAEERDGIGAIPLTERLMIVQRIAEAVAAAHSVGVLHKDIKPSNILMYHHEDGSFRPRISDFGIGILTDVGQVEGRDITLSGFTAAQLTDNSSSRTGTQMYTPPESLQGHPFTMQGDVYALGVLLYQITIGDLKRPLAQGWQSEVRDPLLREDIERCVAGDLRLRLSNAAELAERLNTIPARRRARTSTLVARAFVYASAPLLLLFLLSVYFATRERTLRTRAEGAEQDAIIRRTEAENKTAEASAINAFLVEMLQASDPNLNDRNTDLTVREALDAAAERLDWNLQHPNSSSNDDLHAHPATEAAIRSAIGTSYRALGLLTQAQPHLERALQIRKEHLGENNADTAESMASLSNLYRDQGRLAESETLATKAFDISKSLVGEHHQQTINALIMLGQALHEQGKLTEAEPIYQHVIDLAREVEGPEHPDTLSSIMNLALLYTELGKFDEAHKLYEDLIATAKRVFGPDHPETLSAMNNLAVLYQAEGKYDTAEPLLDQVLETRKRRIGPDHPATLTSMNNLAAVRWRLGKLSEAAELFEETIRLTEHKLGPEHADTLLAQTNLASLNIDRGKLSEAEKQLVDILAIAKRTLGEAHAISRGALMKLAAVYHAENRLLEAQPLYDRLLELETQQLGPEHPDTLSTMSDVAGLYHDLHEYDKAETLLLKSLDIRLRTIGEDRQDTLILMNNIASLYRDMGRLEDASTMMTRAVSGARKSMQEGHWIIAAFLTTQGKLQTKLKQFDEAENSLLEAHKSMTATFGEDNPRTNDVVTALVDLYDAWAKPEQAEPWRTALKAHATPAAN